MQIWIKNTKIEIYIILDIRGFGLGLFVKDKRLIDFHTFYLLR